MTENPIDNNNKNGVNQKLDDAKNLVKKLFQYIEDNPLIPNSAKEQLLSLYDHYIKIALQAPNLFAFENHQSRMFLEFACHNSIDWLEVEDKANSYIKKLATIVEKIKAQDKYDNKAFIGFQADLEKSLLKLKKRTAILQKRDKEKRIGQEKIARAKLETDKFISEKLSEFNNIPDFAQQILMNEWTNVLVLLHIRKGPNSVEYKSNLKFVDLLLNLSNHQKEAIKLKKPYELLLTIYQIGLQQVAFNKHEIVQKQEQLLQFLQQINKPITIGETISPEDIIKISQHRQNDVLLSPNDSLGTTDDSSPAEIYKTISDGPQNGDSNQSIDESNQQYNKDTSSDKQDASKISETLKQENPESVPKEQSKVTTQESKEKDPVNYTDIVAGLKIGSWFEIFDANGKAIKAKLSWISPISGKHLFVDTQGLKISDKTRPEMVNGLTDKTISIITKV